MTSIKQLGQSAELSFPGETFANNPIQLPAKTGPVSMGERLLRMRHYVVGTLFGKHHWATEWVIRLCGADPKLLFHLVEQSRGYVHFICLVRLALLTQPEDDGNELLYAELLQSKTRKEILNALYPNCPPGILGVLPKLEKKPLRRENYQQLIQSLADNHLRKRLNHAKRVRRDDLVLCAMIDHIPKEFKVSGILVGIKKCHDCQHLLMLIKVWQYVGVKMTQQDIEKETREMNDMVNIVAWFEEKVTAVPFPPPPWPGNDRLKPVCSQQALKDASKRFKNCVKSYFLDVVFGLSYFYVCERPMMIIEMKKDVVLGWGIGDIKGISNNKVDAVRKNEIMQEFSAAGFFFCISACDGSWMSDLGMHIFDYDHYCALLHPDLP